MMDDTKQGINDAASAGKSSAEGIGSAAKSATDTLRDAGQKMRDNFQSSVGDPARRAGEAIKATGEKMQQSSSTLGIKMIEQAERNAHAAFEAMRTAAAAKDLSEVMKVQGEFLREQGNRSMTQAREMGELIMQFGRDAVGSMRGGS